MSDARLRDAERRWRESGAAEDEAAWLRERVRVGELAQGRLHLAAWLGHPAANLACGGVLPATLQAWYCSPALDRWEPEARLRMAVAAARHAVGALPDDSLPRARLILRRAQRLLMGEEPSSEPLPDWPAEQAEQRPLDWRTYHEEPEPPGEAARSAFDSLERLVEVWSRGRPVSPADERGWAAGVVAGSARMDGDATLFAVRDEVVPWALGLADPAREQREPL